MDSTQGKISHVSETATVKCRVCKLVLRRKNYKAHLKALHPKDDPGDLSGWCQNKITSMFAVRDVQHVDVTDQEVDLAGVDDREKPTKTS